MALVAVRRQLVPTARAAGVPAAEPVTEDVAAAAREDERPDFAWVVTAWLLVVGGAFAGYGLYEWIDPKAFEPGADISLFAPLYILAQGIERLLEPFTSAFGKTEGKTKNEAANERDQALADAKLEVCAEKQALVNRIRRNRAVIVWGAASLLAMLACGAFGIRLLSAARFDVPAFWDIALTGLAVGAGTKPLHDLISNIQKAKESREDPPAVQTTT
jgi:hypothetical protein